MKLKELGLKIIDLCGTEDVERLDDIVIDGISYALSEISDEGWTDEGKYQYSSKVYQVGIADEKYSYNIAEGKELDLFIKQDCTRSGSYFSDYYYDYEEPYMVKKEIKTITVEKWVSIN